MYFIFFYTGCHFDYIFPVHQRVFQHVWGRVCEAQKEAHKIPSDRQRCASPRHAPLRQPLQARRFCWCEQLHVSLALGLDSCIYIFLRSIEFKIEIKNSRKHIGSKNLPLSESLIHGIYLLKELWYLAALWERPEGGRCSLPQCAVGNHHEWMGRLALDERFRVVKTCFENGSLVRAFMDQIIALLNHGDFLQHTEQRPHSAVRPLVALKAGLALKNPTKKKKKNT